MRLAFSAVADHAHVRGGEFAGPSSPPGGAWSPTSERLSQIGGGAANLLQFWLCLCRILGGVRL
jgi:hypothetical protein